MEIRRHLLHVKSGKAADHNDVFIRNSKARRIAIRDFEGEKEPDVVALDGLKRGHDFIVDVVISQDGPESLFVIRQINFFSVTAEGTTAA